MRESFMFSRFVKISEMVERFITRSVADFSPAQFELAPHLPVVALERYQMPAMQGNERIEVEEKQRHGQAEIPPCVAVQSRRVAR